MALGAMPVNLRQCTPLSTAPFQKGALRVPGFAPGTQNRLSDFHCLFNIT